MKKIILSALAIGFYVFSFSQIKTIDPKITKNKNGIIQSVEFPDSIDKSKIPSSSLDFINEFIKPSENEYFILEPSKDKKKDFKNEHYDQYFKGIKVEGAGYNFHYKNGKMFYAHGNYFKIGNLSVAPSITEENAKDCFVKYKNIPIDSVTGYVSELLIKNVSDEQNPFPQLVYKIYLYANHENNNEIGYIDAHSCKVLLTEPSILDWAATGTFATRYSGSRQAITQNYSGSFHLADSTRGAIIHTWNLNGSTNIQNRIELSDNDNNWTAAEHSANENDMGLDVHWALQQIYTRLNNVHGINSFNNNGFAIDAHIRYGTTNNDRDNAGWNPTLNLLVFGDGAVNFRPVASVDAVAHEFGHGITDFQIGWGVTGDPRAFHEGLSDIWGAIFESRIQPNSTWQIGEQITLNHACLRNIQNTNDPNAMQPIANTFGSSQYNSGDSYVRSGVFSHWFYLLVNGGSGTNDVGNVYTVHGIGMDYAEELIVESVYSNYLNFNTTYPTIRTSMVNAANSLFGTNSFQANQVENAWYAVGVGSQPTQVTITGSTPVCYSTGVIYTANNKPSGSSISWTTSSNLTVASGGSTVSPTIRARNSSSTGAGWVQANFTSNGYTSSIRHTVEWVGVPSTGSTTIAGGYSSYPSPFPCIYTYGQRYGVHLNGYMDGVTQGYQWSGLAQYITDYGTGATFYPMNQGSPYYGSGYIQVVGKNQCGSSVPVAAGYGPCGYYMLFPNPADDYVEITTRASLENDNTKEATATAEIFEKGVVKIYNSFGNLLQTDEIETNWQRFSISNLKEGVYIVEISTKSRTERLQLVVKH